MMGVKSGMLWHLRLKYEVDELTNSWIKIEALETDRNDTDERGQTKSEAAPRGLIQ